MQRQMVWLTGLTAAAVVAAAAWMVHGGGEPAPDAAAPGGAAGGAQDPLSDPAALTPDQMRGRLFEQQAMAGTQGLGNWCVEAQALQPCPALRERFDHYIDTVGQGDPAKLRAAISDEARKENGDRLGAEIMQIWDKYWRLRSHKWHAQLDPADTRTWMQVYEEQTQVRRQMLGEAWAKAFFDADEKQFLAYHQYITTGRNPSAAPPSAPVPTMNP